MGNDIHEIYDAYFQAEQVFYCVINNPQYYNYLLSFLMLPIIKCDIMCNLTNKNIFLHFCPAASIDTCTDFYYIVYTYIYHISYLVILLKCMRHKFYAHNVQSIIILNMSCMPCVTLSMFNTTYYDHNIDLCQIEVLR